MHCLLFYRGNGWCVLQSNYLLRR